MMDTDSELHSPRAEVPTIFIVSRDMGCCVSLRLQFQNRYKVITTTDPMMLMTIVRSCQPDLVIIDNLPTEIVPIRIETMKKGNRNLRIIFFSSASPQRQRLPEHILDSIDAIFSKPIDLTEVASCIEKLIGSPTSAV